MHYVYMYCDPRKCNVPVYVGMGKNDRAWHHLRKSSNRQLNNLVKKLQRDGIVIEPYIVMSNLSLEEAWAEEMRLIELYGRRNLKSGILFNLTAGGDGVKEMAHSNATKEIISKHAKQIMQDEEYKAAWRERQKAGCKTERALAKKSKATAAGWQNEETRRKRSEGIKVSRSTEESRAKTRAQQEAQWTADAKKKASDFAKERLQDPVTKVRSSVANAYNWCRRQGRAYSEVSFPAL